MNVEEKNQKSKRMILLNFCGGHAGFLFLKAKVSEVLAFEF